MVHLVLFLVLLAIGVILGIASRWPTIVYPSRLEYNLKWWSGACILAATVMAVIGMFFHVMG